MNEMIKIASSQLHRTPDYKIVKVAGILRRLKNWLKSKLDKEFQEKVQTLETESAYFSQKLSELQGQISKVQEAIADKELEEYRQELNKLKKLLPPILRLNLSAQKAATELSKEIQEQLTKEKLEDPKYLEKIKTWLSTDQGFDILLDQDQSTPVQSTKFYKGVGPERVKFTDKNWKLGIFPSIASALNANLSMDLQEQLDPIIKTAIVNGVITNAQLQFPVPGYDSPATGVVKLNIISAPYTIPGFNAKVQTKFLIRDTSPGKNIKTPEMAIIEVGKTTIVSEKPAPNPLAAASSFNRLDLLKSYDASHRINFYNSIIKNAFAPGSFKEEIKITTYSEVDFARILKKGYKLVFNKEPSLHTLAFGWAQAAIEHGTPFVIKENNIGNIRATPDWIKAKKPFFTKAHKEFTDTGKSFLDPGAAWRAYPSPELGAAGYWDLLKRKYPDVLKWAAGGDPQSAGVVLGQIGYYTQSIDKYSSSLKSLYNRFMKQYAKNFPELSDEIEEINEEKPEVKTWRSEYNLPSQGKGISSTPNKNNVSSNMEPEDYDLKDEDIEEIEEDIPLSTKSFALTRLVKEAIDKQDNNKSKLLIKVEGSDFIDNLEYANNLSSLIQDYLNGSTIITNNKEDFYLEASSPISNNFKQAVDELSNVLSEEINKKTNKNVYAITSENLISFYPELNQETIASNHRKFLMRHS